MASQMNWEKRLKCFLTARPASLLCKFIFSRNVRPRSPVSTNSLASLYPNTILSEHPPHSYSERIFPKTQWSKERRKRNENLVTWNTRIEQVINSQFLPIVSHLKLIRTCLPAAAHSDGSSHMYMIQSTLRYMRERLNVSLLHLWWHK